MKLERSGCDHAPCRRFALGDTPRSPKALAQPRRVSRSTSATPARSSAPCSTRISAIDRSSPRPNVEGRQKLGLIDQPALERKHPEHEVARQLGLVASWKKYTGTRETSNAGQAQTSLDVSHRVVFNCGPAFRLAGSVTREKGSRPLASSFAAALRKNLRGDLVGLYPPGSRTSGLSWRSQNCLTSPNAWLDQRMASNTTATSARAIIGSNESIDWCSLVSIQINSESPELAGEIPELHAGRSLRSCTTLRPCRSRAASSTSADATCEPSA